MVRRENLASTSCAFFMVVAALALSPSYAAPPVFVSTWGTQGTQEGEFMFPVGVALDGDGALYLADSHNHRIQKFTSDGTFLTTFGVFGLFGDGELNHPEGVAVAPDGSIFVTDTYNHRIQKFTSEGVFVTQWGTPGDGPSQFYLPGSIAVGGNGDVYVAELTRTRVQRFDGQGMFVTQWGQTGTGDGEFQAAFGVVVEQSGNVLVTDPGLRRIQRFTPSGQFLEKWTMQVPGEIEAVHGSWITRDQNGAIYVSDAWIQRSLVFAPGGKFGEQWGTPGPFPGQYDTPLGIAVDFSYVYVADRDNHRIQKYRFDELPTAAPEVATVSALMLKSAPNPFNPRTILVYSLPEPGFVALTIHDVRGLLMATLVDGVASAGNNQVPWDGRTAVGAVASSGVYFARLVFNGQVRNKRLVLAK